MSEDERGAMRRTPRQERGRLRVARILDAAEASFGEVGYETATTNQIAARAGVPIGSLYHFFPNKEALLHAVAERYREAASASPAAATLPAERLAGLVLQTMVGFGTSRMGLTKIVLQAGANDALAAAAAGIMSDATSHLVGALALRHPAMPEARRLIVARVALTAVMALLGLITAEKARGPEFSAAVLAETHALLAAYISALDAAGPASDGTIP